MGRDGALEALGQQLGYLRKARGMTLTEAARRAGASVSHLSNVEHGRDRPSTHIVAFYEEEFHGDGQAWGLYDALVTANRPRQRRSIVDDRRYPIPGDESTFVADITVPDGTVMPPYHKFDKIWRIRNSGSVPWTGRWLARRGAPAGHGVPASPYRVRIPDTQPGEEVDIGVPVQSQPLAGASQVHWKMVDDDDREYFPQYPLGVVLSIVVDADAPLTEGP
ncbi:NBR1-Ig-like domain-containing protein [Mycobacteroides abscessus]|uniref:NBR1-Ig-like domain-containing protein n=1 Tax=Mycobacteroides abscessus TaxID=36809 RepID=UPI00266C7316|nr:NBR1-Ig-like domain-containing protein [Mycobacteroides abscessus]MDO3175899.1 NBR1-Ig-like domain-containing protein [Mycobacteroides abscessus subsp. abscessus]